MKLIRQTVYFNLFFIPLYFISVYSYANEAIDKCYNLKDGDNIPFCRQALKENQNSLKLTIVLAKSLEGIHSYQKAKDIYENGLKVFPENKYLKKRLSIASSFLDETEWQKQRQALQQEKDIVNKKKAKVKVNILKCKKFSGLKALKACDDALAVLGNNPELLLSKAKLQFSLKQYHQSLKNYQSVLAIIPSQDEAIKKVDEINQLLANFSKKTIAQNRKQTIIATTTASASASAPLPNTTPALKSKPKAPAAAKVILPEITFQELVDESASQTRVALVIGNADYQNAPLRNPVNDAKDMSKALKQYGFNVTSLINADLRKMNKEISQFGKKLKGDNTVGLFYYAGHGLQIQGKNYLVPIGANIEGEADIAYEAVDAGRILSQMEFADNGLNMVILDACRNNPFARSWRSTTKGLAKMEAPAGSLMLYATSPGNVAADGKGNNGLFTENLLKNMSKNGLKIEDIFKQTAISVSKTTKKMQIPYIEGVILGDFYFKSITKDSMQKLAKNDQSLKVERDFWQTVISAPSEEMYQAYLDQYPNGYFARLAKIKLKAVRK
ncbi:MAG: caspase family protein [Gammaproteobacteria bacterium]|nr:caspase family protein [Gammaproteobacteria bacterium]